MSRLVDPDAPVEVEVRSGRRYIALPSKEEAAQRVHQTLKKITDLPAPPDASNPIAVALSYELFGLGLEETAIAMSIPLAVLNSLRATEHYSQFKQAVLSNIRQSTVDIVTQKFEEAQAKAATKVTDLVDSPSGVIALRAATIVLDRSQGQRTIDPMKAGLQIIVYTNNQPEPKVVEHAE